MEARSSTNPAPAVETFVSGARTATEVRASPAPTKPRTLQRGRIAKAAPPRVPPFARPDTQRALRAATYGRKKNGVPSKLYSPLARRLRNSDSANGRKYIPVRFAVSKSRSLPKDSRYIGTERSTYQPRIGVKKSSRRSSVSEGVSAPSRRS